jgi:hypothetical protein
MEELKTKSSKSMNDQKDKIEKLKKKNDEDIKEYVPLFKDLQKKVFYYLLNIKKRY